MMGEAISLEMDEGGKQLDIHVQSSSDLRSQPLLITCPSIAKDGDMVTAVQQYPRGYEASDAATDDEDVW